MIKIERIYRDTSNYEEKKGLPFAKAFAKSLEWLYDKSYFSEEDDDFLWHAKYQMSGEIPLYDLMSIEALVISRAWSDFRVSGVNTLISQLEAGASPLSTHELKYDGDHLIIGGFQRHLMEVILWAAYIYCLFRSELDKDNINAKRASQLLHELFVQKAGDPESDIEGHFLMEHLNQTMVTFAKNLQTKHRPSENKKAPDTKDDSTAELQSRIAELEAELAKAQADIEAYEQQGKGVSAAKHALLLTTLCQHLGGLPQNGRQSLSYILQKLYGYTESTAEKALKQKVTQKDANALAKLFHGISPHVENLIAGMPKLLEELNNERLRRLNEQKNQKK